MTRHHKHERHEVLRELIRNNPFLTDGELAQNLRVSVSTVRLDRSELGIPELRERTRVVAHEAYDTLKSLGQQELIGQLKDLIIGEKALSEMLIEESMVLSKARVARGHHLFAQANSLAIALVDADVAVTGSVNLKFIRPVHLGELVIAEARVLNRRTNKYKVEIVSRVEDDEVLHGEWVLFAFDSPLESKEVLHR